MKIPPPAPIPVQPVAPRADAPPDRPNAGTGSSSFALALTGPENDPKPKATQDDRPPSRSEEQQPDETRANRSNETRAKNSEDAAPNEPADAVDDEAAPAETDIKPDRPAKPEKHGKGPTTGKPEDAAKAGKADADKPSHGATPPGLQVAVATPAGERAAAASAVAAVAAPAETGGDTATTTEAGEAADASAAVSAVTAKRAPDAKGAARRTPADADAPKDADAKPTTGEDAAAGPTPRDRAEAKPVPPAHDKPAKDFASHVPADARNHAPSPPPTSVAPQAAQATLATDAFHPARGDTAQPGSGDGTSLPAAFGTDPSATHARATSGTTALYAARPVVVPPPVQQVALHITRAAEDGIDRFTVQLKPADLGKISAQIEIHDHDRVHIIVSAQRQDTLDALQRDARVLERALQDAGLRADSGSLSFQFQGNNAHTGGDGPAGRPTSIVLPASAMAGEEIPSASLAATAAALRRGGVDVRV